MKTILPNQSIRKTTKSSIIQLLLFLTVCLPLNNSLLAQRTADSSDDRDSKYTPHLIVPKKVLLSHAKDLVFQEYFPLSPADKMNLVKTETDKLGFTHEKYQQTYKNVVVEGAFYTIHSKNGMVQSLSGDYMEIDDLQVTPSISLKDAFEKSLKHVDAKEYVWEPGNSLGYTDKQKPEGELVVYADPRGMKDARLAYKFEIFAAQPLYRADVFIDAHTGNLVAEHNRLYDADVPATGNSEYQGNVSFTADQTAPNNFRLRQMSSGSGVETFNLNNTFNYGAATDFTSTTSNFTSDDVGVQAHYCTEQTYDYFWAEHGRNSYDDAGAVLRSYVHAGNNYVNAFWDGSRMTYGDGNGTTISPLVTLDICGHEITHGVTQFSANLVYQNEPGALNESFSDIFGEAVERHALGNNDWLLGAEIFINGGAIRDMSDPNAYSDPDTYLGTHWHFGPSDNGGVHTNSGVQNFWFYLLAVGGSGTNDNGDSYNITGLGFDVAEDIAYRNLTVYLGVNSQYVDARTGAIQAAIDLFGTGSTEANTVAAAWDAVGVYGPPPPVDNNAMTCGLGIDVPPGNCVLVPIQVSGEAGNSLGNDIKLQSLDLIIEHPWNDDLDIYLRSPNGIERQVSTDNGGNGDNYGDPNNCPNTVATFIQNATQNVATLSGVNTNISGSWRPEQSFNDFNDGTDPNGTWTLRICDDFVPADEGTLEYVKLSFCGGDDDIACNATPVAVGTWFNADGTCAFAQPGEIDPGVGTGADGCNAQDGWCNYSIDNEPGIQNSTWYTFSGPSSGHVEIYSDDFDDTQLALYTVGNCSNFSTYVEVAANDDSGPGFAAAVICAQVVPGAIYYLQVDGYNGFPYNTNIMIEEIFPIINDDVCDALPITIGQPVNATSESSCGDATAQPGEAVPPVGSTGSGCDSQDGWCSFEPPTIQNSLWYTFVAPASGQVDIETDDQDDTQLAIWSAGDCNDFGSFVLMAANDDSGDGFSPFIDNACLEPGQTYYLQIDGYDGEDYNTNITVSEVGTALVISCPPNVTVECDESADPPATGEATANTNDCCTNAPNIGWSDNPPNAPACSYAITRTWTATYDCGEVRTCDQTVTIYDPAPVIVTCPDDQTIEWPAGFNTQPVGPNTPQDPSIDPSNYNNIVYTETCLVSIDYQDVLIGPSPGNCPNLWTVERTWTLTDDCGQTGTCVQTFTFTDTTDPVITCPADPAVIEWPAGFNTNPVPPNTPQDPSIAPAIYGTATATDNCGTPAITYQDVIYGPVPGDCPNLWTVQRTWTATDACGLTHSCVQTFTFSDTTPPVITTCPSGDNIEGCGTDDIAADGHPPYSTVLVGTEAEFIGSGGAASDNCAIVAWNYIDVANGTCPITVTRTWTVTDACGLVATCTQVFTIDDTTAPNAVCQNITISLTANGDYNLTPSEVFDAANSSDNCGTVTPVSVTPNLFDCQDEGGNNVTLTVEDACGNPATCPATVTINEFITNISAVPSAETCAGANDGQILASGSAGGGELKFSIDGINFQSGGLFTDVAAGTYTVTFKVFGIPSLCEKTLTVTVSEGPQPQNCYLDSDGDGYSAVGVPPVSACNCPTGYISNPTGIGNDCNDNEAAVNPGAAEACDGLDNNCDGVVPANEVDADGDGYRICDGDCDDSNAAVNPGAAEVCDGLDNNCDGNIDEGLSGLTFNGNVFFSTQAQVDAWAACYSIINGNVTILGTGINNLGPLANIAEITGNLTIQSTGLSNTNGLDALATVGGTLTFYFNSSLTSLSGLGALSSVGGGLSMYYNFILSDCCPIYDLLNNGGVTGAIIIFFNSVGCNSLAEILATCAPPPPLVGGPTGFTTTGTSATLPEGKTISLFPNPASNEVTILFLRNAPMAKLTMVDLLGRTVLVQELEEGVDRLTLDLSKGQFKNGLYLISIVEDGEKVTSQLVIQK